MGKLVLLVSVILLLATPIHLLINKMATNIKVQFSSESVEWYTPARYMDAVRRVLNGIELDPASCEDANQTVQAARYFTVDTDGLSQEWWARSVFLNPPYGTRNGKSNQGLLSSG